MDGIGHFYFKILIPTTARDNVLDWMYKSQIPAYGTIPSCFSVL